MSSDTFDTIDKYVDQGEKNKAHDEKEKGGSDRLQDSIHRLKPKDQSLNEMYDPPGRDIFSDAVYEKICFMELFHYASLQIFMILFWFSQLSGDRCV